LNIDFKKQKKKLDLDIFWVWILDFLVFWIFFGFGFWIFWIFGFFLGLDFGFFGFLDFFWFLGFPSKSNPKTQLFLGSNLWIKIIKKKLNFFKKILADIS
jgi:hypothetical protein